MDKEDQWFFPAMIIIVIFCLMFIIWLLIMVLDRSIIRYDDRYFDEKIHSSVYDLNNLSSYYAFNYSTKLDFHNISFYNISKPFDEICKYKRTYEIVFISKNLTFYVELNSTYGANLSYGLPNWSENKCIRYLFNISAGQRWNTTHHHRRVRKGR